MILAELVPLVVISKINLSLKSFTFTWQLAIGSVGILT